MQECKISLQWCYNSERKYFLTISMPQLFDTFCLGVTKHLTRLKSVLMFSLMLQGHTETHDWFQIVGRIRGGKESQMCTPCPSNSLFLHFLPYFFPWKYACSLNSLQSALHPFHLWDFLVTYSVDLAEGIQGHGSCMGHNWDTLPTAGTSNVKFAAQDVGISGCGTLKTGLLIYKTKSSNTLIILTLL